MPIGMLSKVMYRAQAHITYKWAAISARLTDMANLEQTSCAKPSSPCC
ncbi:hypothetical protein [Rhodanobacter umsongensis]